MTTLFSNCPMEFNMCRVINDTFPFQFTIKEEDGMVVDITSFSFKLTVDPSDEPSGSGDNLFSLIGTITDAPNGIVEFEPTAEQADQTPDTYYFDVQMIDADSKVRTIAKGEWNFTADITK